VNKTRTVIRLDMFKVFRRRHLL